MEAVKSILFNFDQQASARFRAWELYARLERHVHVRAAGFGRTWDDVFSIFPSPVKIQNGLGRRIKLDARGLVELVRDQRPGSAVLIFLLDFADFVCVSAAEFLLPPCRQIDDKTPAGHFLTPRLLPLPYIAPARG